MTTTVSLLFVLLTQTVSSEPADPQAKTQAQTLLSEGTALYGRGDFAGALDKFQAAYAIYPSPKLKFDIAQADRDLGRPVEAIEAFEQFLAQAPKSAPELLSEAYQSVADLRSKLAQLRIQCETADSEVAIDGKTVGTTPLDRAIWTTPGRHEVVIRHEGYRPITLTVAAGEHQTIVFEPNPSRGSLLAAPTASPENATPAMVATTTPSSTERKSGGGQDWLSRQRWYVWVAAGGTVAFTVGAIAAGLSANSLFDDLRGSCGATTAGCTPSQKDSVHTRATLANVFWAFAGVSAVATGVSLYVDNRDAGVAVAWRF